MSERYQPFKKIDAERLWAQKDIYEVENFLKQCKESDFVALYDKSLKALNDGDGSLGAEYKTLLNFVEKFNIDLFTFMLFEFPYHWRCKLLHGDRTTMLFATANDYELSSLKIANYFMNRFLNDIIPKLFDENFWSEQKQHKMYGFIKTVQEYESANDIRKTFKYLEKIGIKI